MGNRWWSGSFAAAMCCLMLITIILLDGCSSVPFRKCEEPWDRHMSVQSRFLHQEGNKLVDSSGRPVVLHAVNIGGWLHWEAWIFGGKLRFGNLKKGSQRQLLARVRELYGADAEVRFAEAIQKRYITEADIRQIAELGFNSIRLPINHTLLDSESGWMLLDKALEWAAAYNLLVFFDMHAAPGGQSTFFTADPDEMLLWDDPVLQDELVGDWIAIASRYANNTCVGGYDLLNEPDQDDAMALLVLYDRIIKGIRSVDKEHLIIIEGSDLSRSFDLFDERLDENMAYSPHVYLWIGKPDRKWVTSLQELSNCHDVPVWVGEFGEDRIQDIEGLRRGFESLSGWSLWTWKKVDTGGTPGLGEIDAPEQWLKLIASLDDEPGTKAVMTEREAFEALDAFLEAAAKPRIDKNMLKALGQ